MRGKVILTTFILIFISTPLVFADTITIKSDEWCPYNCEPESEKPGYMIEVAKRVFEEAGHKVEYSLMTWSRCIMECRNGVITAIPGASKDEVPDFVFTDEELGASFTSFFTLKKNPWMYNGVKSLEEVKVGIQKDYDYGVGLDEYFALNKGTMKVQEISNENPLGMNIRKMVKGRIDVIPEDHAVFMNVAKDMGVLDQIKNAGMPPIINKEDYEGLKLYLAFSPKNPKSQEYAEMLSNGIAAMRESGELEKILNKYGLEDWKKDLSKAAAELNISE